MTSHPLAHLVGHRLPGGEFTLPGYVSWIAHDALYSPPSPSPHPVMPFVAAQLGMGLSVAELFRLLGSDVEDGPLLAESRIDSLLPLVTDARYAVTGSIADIVRKRGRALGQFDLVTCVFTIIDDGGRDAAVVTNVYAITRKEPEP